MPSGIYQATSETEPIVAIQFGIFSPEEIEKRSVVEVTSYHTYDGNEPRIGGLFDPRMGVLDNGKTCRSCGQTNHHCPGHFGHYKLARPVYYIQFMPYILNTLSCICIRCSKLLIDKEVHKKVLKKRGEARWKELLKICSGITRCGQEGEDGCGAKKPNRFVSEGIARIKAEWTVGTQISQPLEVEYVLRLFRRISDQDVDFLGLSRHWCRPDWMVCSVLPIPPPQVRPSVVQDNNQRSEDDLTHKLFELIKSNQILQQKIDANADRKLIDEMTDVLQYHVATLVNNKLPGVAPSAQRSGRPLKSIQQRLGSKEGRIRYNIQGKRVEFSARSVITPDPNLSIGELGVPLKIAMNLTFPEKVTPYNKAKLYKLIQNGADVYPGAKTVVSADGRMTSLRHVATKEIVLYDGDTVNRHLMDGDIVLFNRQPTLHRMSMMGHRVRVLPYNTFRLNVMVCAPYNADFDGDEMNMHCPQSYEAAVELGEIAAVQHQIITPRDSKPVIGVVQDTLVGSYRLTRPGNLFNKREIFNLMMWNKRFDGQLPEAAEAGKWNGSQVMSTMLPPLNMSMKNKLYNDKDDADKDYQNRVNVVKIREGEVQQGTFDKEIFSKAGKGIIHVTYNDYGSKETVNLLDTLQNTIEQFLIYNGFSVGISDLVADDTTRQKMEEEINIRKKKIEEITLQVHQDLFNNNTGKSNRAEFEDKVFTAINEATSVAGKLGLQSLADENRMTAMIRAGSKGSEYNVAQMIACVGQQAIEGKRVPYGFTDRTLPHFKKYDDGAEARGFIESSFVRGLSPSEFFFHAMSGREGLIDTAVKSVTGDTPIVIVEDGKARRVLIGEWIDTLLDSNEDYVEHFPKDRNLEMLNLEKKTFIPTTDANGNVSWGEITAITRHDPGERLYQIKTLAGKSVIVSESQSLLIWDAASKTFQRKESPLVQTGDAVPVTQLMPAPPVTTEYITVSDYLSKKDYLYGTDFENAKLEMNLAMEGREKIPAGWWESHNGAAFTLPYSSKARFQRTQVRSNTENIKAGFVYPFTTNRDHARIPDKLELNERNGIFIGLFLAEGNVDVKSGYIQITNNNENIRQFAMDWFEDMRIQYQERIKQNHIGGTSSSVRGFSTVLAKLFDEMVGHGAENKRVPNEAFTAPDSFIKGLLNGYFSGDGTVTANSFEIGSASSELIDGISMLCTRFGIFGKIFKTQLVTNNLGTKNILPTYRMAIRAQWAIRFASLIELIDTNKDVKRRIMKNSEIHRNFPVCGDCVLDEIVEINVLSTEAYPKLYDMTVPSTLNFGLANGLHVVDTADTGYIQRQLVKSMEDLITHFDGTVRDAKGNVIQFHYGEDGISATKIEGQGLGITKMSQDDIRKTFSMEDADFTAILSEGVERESDTEVITAYVEQVLADRKMLVETMFGNGAEQGIMAPVNLERILLNMKTRFNLKSNATTDLTPSYVLEGMSRLIERTQPYNRLWQALVRYHLAPHSLIVRDRFTKKAFDTLIEIVITRNWKAWAIPGEQVGIVAAQSIGEPATQMCCQKNTRVVINTSQKLNYTGGIGKFVDSLLEKHSDKVVPFGDNKLLLDLDFDEDYYILSVAKDEKTAWKRISQVSRLPANGGLVKVTTRSGRKTTATLSHSFLKRAPTGVVPVLGSELRVGDRVPIARELHEVPYALKELDGFQLTKDFGWLCGMYLADGNLNSNTVSISKVAPVVEERIRKMAESHPDWNISIRESEGEYGPSKSNNINSAQLKNFLLKHFGTGSYEKRVGGEIFHTSKEFIAGIVAGYFDGDGNVNVERQQIRASSRNEQLIRDINLMLSYCGMFGVIGEEGTVNMPGKIQYTLNILKKYAQTYKDVVGFTLPEKAAALDEIIAYMEREDKHNTAEQYDKIPELGEIIADTGRLLRMPGQSRTYGRWRKKESVGRLTLETYIQNFKEMMDVHVDPGVVDEVNENLAILEQAVNSDVVWDEIVELEYLSDPKEYVYDFTVPGNESFMVDDAILVHNTLNSVDWDTEIMIMKDGKVVAPQIGEFIDNYYRDCDKEKVQHLPNGQIYIPLEDGHEWKAVSCDESGKMMWTKLEAITRHPVVNEDGTNTILKVTTEGGRVVKATKGHSFLTLVDGKVKDINGSDLNVGDILPIAQSLASADIPIIEPEGELTLSNLLQAPDNMVVSYMREYIEKYASMNNNNEIILEVEPNSISDIVVLLTRFNIYSVIYSENTVVIPRKWMLHFTSTFLLDCEMHNPVNDAIRIDTQWKETNDMVWDKIKSIEEVAPMGEGWVYDLTVEKTRNFLTKTCLAQRDTFHLAGVAAKSNVTRGVPRLKELLKVTKSPKATTLTVYLKPEYRESKEKAREVSQDLELTLLRDITVKTAIYYDPKMDETVLEEDKELLNFYNLFEQRMKEASGTEEEESWSKWMLRLEFDREKMFNKNISMDDIAFVLNTHFGQEVNMVYSDYNSQKLVMRIRLFLAAGVKGESTLDGLRLLKNFQNKMLNGIVIRGLSGIKAAPFRFLSQELEQFRTEKDGKYELIQEYILDTDGSNFLEVANHPAVDSTRLTSSHVHDILPYLGVEAARATLISEMTTLFSEVGINYRHVGLLTDVMTRAGRLMSVDRYGINKMDIGPLAKASFEETGNILLRAAIFGEMDPVTGVSANIMTGQAIRGGTAFSQILLDEQAFVKLQETADVLDREEEEAYELDDDLIYDEIHQDPNDRCSTTRLKMNMVLPNAEMEIEDEEVEIRLLD